MNRIIRSDRCIVLVLIGLFFVSLCSGCLQVTIPQEDIQLLIDDVAYILPDGAYVHLAFYPGDSKKLYVLENATQLLAIESSCNLAESVSSGTPGFQALPRSAQSAILSYYENKEPEYEIEPFLLCAYGEYQTDPSAFQPFFIQENTIATTTSEDILFCKTNLLLPLTDGSYERYSVSQGFSRENGTPIDRWSIFSVDREQAIASILTYYPSDAAVEAILMEEFDPKYMELHYDSFEVILPAHILAAYGLNESVSFVGPYTDQIRSILQPWAIPLE